MKGENRFPFWTENSMLVSAGYLISQSTPEEFLYGYGPLGVGVVVLGYFGYKLFNIILSDRDKAIKDRDTMLEDVFTKVLPAISRNTEILENRKVLDQEILTVLKTTDTRLAENTKAFEELKYVMGHDGGGPRAGGRSAL